MPPKKTQIDCDLEPYLQYHNRIASFLEWNLDWELSEDKPSPERLARAGFFSFTKPPFQPDNVVCAYCGLTLDNWDPQDDPMHEHKARSPFCDFVLGRNVVRNTDDDDEDKTATVPLEVATSEQNSTVDSHRPKRPCKKRAAAASKATELALAGANGDDEGPPKKRRPGRPRKQRGPG